MKNRILSLAQQGFVGISLTWLIWATGCGQTPSHLENRYDVTRGERLVLRGGRMLDGTSVDVEIRGHTIAKVGEVNAPGVDIEGMYLVPAFIDSHVHLSLFATADDLSKTGIAGVVDLASPQAGSKQHSGPLFMKTSGPMITAERGYPTQAWGKDGYGRECADKKSALAAAKAFLKAGADLIKIPIGANGLPVPWAEAVIEYAHEQKAKVVVHALGSEDAAKAGELATDVLAHVPIEAMDEATLDIWGKRAVVTTLAAFGGSKATLTNLRELRDRGAIIMYGTDLGNVQYVGIHPDEIELMVAAGMDAQSIIASATSVPAEFWGFDYLGAIAAGKAASFMLLAENPLDDPLALTRPSHVYIDGVRIQ